MSECRAAIVGADLKGERSPQDFYRTPSEAVTSLMKRETFPGLVWEPACGDGAISEVLLDYKGHEYVPNGGKGPKDGVYSSDKYDWGYGVPGVDFLGSVDALPLNTVDHVVTNPPYGVAKEFVQRALYVTTGKVAMFLKLTFLEGKGRHVFLDHSPLRSVYVFSGRVKVYRHDIENLDSRPTGYFCYAWFIWEHGYRGKPEIDWIYKAGM